MGGNPVMTTYKVLVCDDEPHILHVVSAKLRNNGFEILTAVDGAEGYELARAEHPDLIFTDYQMPYLSGLELCAKLRTEADTRDIPVVMLSARGFVLSDAEISATNIKTILVKPFSPREVLATARRILDGAEAPDDGPITATQAITG